MSSLRLLTILVAMVPSVTFAVPSLESMVAGSREPSSIKSTVQSKSRLSHAKELLGGTYKKSVVRMSESIVDISGFIEATTQKFLPKTNKKVSKKLAKAILKSAKEYQFDPVFLMAVIQNESSFNPNLKGGAGEIGLMQIKPTTAEWIAGIYKIKYKGEASLYDPIINVRIGAALMDKLRHQFESHSRLYLSAYNIGATKVRSMVEDKKIPKDYVQAVMKRYIAIYSAFRENGDAAKRSEIAFAHTLDITKRVVQAKLDTNKLISKIEAKIEAKLISPELQTN